MHMKQKIEALLSARCPWRDTLHWYDSIGSTNDEAKRLALSGAPYGTVLIAGHQSAGRGRLGRSFQSPANMGIYLSVILRPQCPPQALMHLTCAAAVAMCDAVHDVSGLYPGIKWTNDLVIGTRKLGGILTELSVDPQTGNVAYAIVGIGINCCQKTEDFPPELQDMAISLSCAADDSIDRAALAAAMVWALYRMDASLLTMKDAMMERYRKHCITVGKQIVLLRGDEKQYGTALSVDNNGGLVVKFQSGEVKTVSSGEVSVRGMYGYV